MYQQPIFLKPVFKDRIWGGTKLREIYNYNIPTETTGECWGISAHPNGPNEILNGPLQGKTLLEAWQNHRELFAHQEGLEFPLLTKILDASQDLSVQVHPDDTYAKEVENYPFGKTECWYIIDCEEDSELIFGHHASTKEEFEQLVKNGAWNDLLRRVKVKPGEFYYIPSGTIHAIGKGILLLETQQSSDITYRVYDYDRRDSVGHLRELHIEKSIDVSSIPHKDVSFRPSVTVEEGFVSKLLIEEDYFTVQHWKGKGSFVRETNNNYYLFSVLEGDGVVQTKEGDFPFKKGDHFIIPSTLKEYKISGDTEIIVSNPTLK
ncbi:mannose-6-phosphate isomerase, class I [Bacillus sp. DJP31]|uniref:mannose-6-phosphate isomerase, class I n=1 Tax=Bacillus sp. DJP31 TaxID=3409789 RepID=UPI003BB60900